jgi:hypothetical protein
MREYECQLRRVVLRPVVQHATVTVQARTLQEAEERLLRHLEEDRIVLWRDHDQKPEEVEDCEVLSVEEAEGIDLASLDP